MFMAAFFLIAPNWKQFKCWKGQTGLHPYNGKLLSNENELLIHATIWVNVKKIMLSKKKPDKMYIWYVYVYIYVGICIYACTEFQLHKILEYTHSSVVPESRSEITVLSPSAVSDTWWPFGLQPARLFCPWDCPSKITELGCHFLLQGVFWPRDRTHVPYLSWIGR